MFLIFWCHVLQFRDRHITSEYDPKLEKMVLKITKPPRDKDSIASLIGQGLAWMVHVSFSNCISSESVVRRI